MTDRILKIDLDKNVDDVLDNYEKEKPIILEKLLNIGLNYYVPEEEKDELIDEAMILEEDVPYFPESHREAIDLVEKSINKLDQEVQKRKEKDENDNARGMRNSRY